MSLPVVGLVSHTMKVKSLYKRVLRNLEAFYVYKEVYRYYAVLMRQRFDENSGISDMRLANRMVQDAEAELFKKWHWNPKTYPNSPGGCSYLREVVPPDWVVDMWHPLEKAAYPDYFARREKRKREYVFEWKKRYQIKD